LRNSHPSLAIYRHLSLDTPHLFSCNQSG